MTIVKREMLQCALCGNTSEQRIIRSTSAFGSPDLDTRPPEMARSLIIFQIQTCPSCGYCAPSIANSLGKLSTLVNSDDYKQQLNNSKFPRLANAYLCYSILEERVASYAKAGWASIHAAWICDDDNLVRGAKKCRQRALDLLRRAMQEEQDIGNQIAAEEALMVDLLRRSRQFTEAQSTCNEGLGKQPGKYIQDILLFQQKLIAKSDANCHCIGEMKDFK